MFFKDRYRQTAQLLFPFCGSSQPYMLILGQSTLFFAASVFFQRASAAIAAFSTAVEATESTSSSAACQFFFLLILQKICALLALLPLSRERDVIFTTTLALRQYLFSQNQFYTVYITFAKRRLPTLQKHKRHYRI